MSKLPARPAAPSRHRRLLAAAITAFAFNVASPATTFARTGVESSAAVAADPQRGLCAASGAGAQAFARTELFFGLSKPDGGVVTEEDFKAFVDSDVTPSFPDGLTLLSGTGQFRDSSGTIIVEGSKVLILLVPARARADASRAIELIRERYKARFQQQSVLRADDVSCVSF